MAIARQLLAVLLCMALFGCTSGSVNEPNIDSAGNILENENNKTTSESVDEVVIEEPESLLIWSYTDEILTEIKSFEEKYNAKVTVEVMDMNGFIPMATGVIKSGVDMPDILVLEESQLGNPGLEPLLMDLEVFSTTADIKSKLAPYSIEKGTTSDGKLVALSYQVSPVGIFYRRSMAIEAFTTDDPLIISDIFSSYDQLSEGLNTLNQLNIKMFADILTLRNFSDLNEKWIDENGLYMKENQQTEFFELIKKAQYDKQVAFAREWSDEWLQGMYKPITNSYGDDMNVFAYFLPSWGLSNILMLTGDSEEAISENEDGSIRVFNDTSGDWAIAMPPHAKSVGSSFIAVNNASEHLELSEQFLDYMVSDEEHIQQWLKTSDILSSYVSIQTQQSFPEGDTFLGGQSYTDVMADIGQQIKTNVYEDIELENKNKWIQEVFDDTLLKFIQGEFHTIDEAIKVFESQIEVMYPELFVVVTPE